MVSGAAEDGKKVGDKTTVHETGKYPGTRAWACQWRKVDVEILKEENWEGEPGQLSLKTKDGGIAEVEIDEHAVAVEGKEEEFDDKFWDEYLDALEELM